PVTEVTWDLLTQVRTAVDTLGVHPPDLAAVRKELAAQPRRAGGNDDATARGNEIQQVSTIIGAAGVPGFTFGDAGLAKLVSVRRTYYPPHRRHRGYDGPQSYAEIALDLLGSTSEVGAKELAALADLVRRVRTGVKGRWKTFKSWFGAKPSWRTELAA